MYYILWEELNANVLAPVTNAAIKMKNKKKKKKRKYKVKVLI